MCGSEIPVLFIFSKHSYFIFEVLINPPELLIIWFVESFITTVLFFSLEIHEPNTLITGWPVFLSILDTLSLSQYPTSYTPLISPANDMCRDTKLVMGAVFKSHQSIGVIKIKHKIKTNKKGQIP